MSTAPAGLSTAPQNPDEGHDEAPATLGLKDGLPGTPTFESRLHDADMSPYPTGATTPLFEAQRSH
jgi:hypothetical protein